MNDRLIKESDVLKAIDKRIKELSKHPEFVRKNGHIDVIGVKKYILAIPSADRPQEWITCRERMPKKEEATYLICTETGHMCSCRWTNNMYGLGSNEWSKWGWHIMDKPQYAKVVAWMPLKPWKGEDDGEDIQSEAE